MILAGDPAGGTSATPAVSAENRVHLNSLLREDQILFEYRNQYVVLSKTKDSTMYTLERQNHLKTVWYQMKQYGTGRGFSISAGISGMVPAEKNFRGL